MAQTGGLVRGKAVAPSLSRLNPLSGLKRLFGFQGVAEVLRGLAKMAVVGAAVWHALDPDALQAALHRPAGGLLQDFGGALLRLLLHALAALAVLAVVAGALAVLTDLALFPLYSLNRDDSVYVAMARLLETGAVTLPADHDAFRPWASAVVGDRIVLKYTPPWPAVIAAGDLLTGSPRAALAVSAAAAAVTVPASACSSCSSTSRSS